MIKVRPGKLTSPHVRTTRLAALPSDRGDLDGLRARADAGDRDAAARLAGLLAE